LHFAEAFAGDVPPQEAATMAATQRAVAGAIFGEPAGPAAWRELETWYQISANDNTINPDLERFFAERMKATTITLPSSQCYEIGEDQVRHRLAQ
jgi:hypothetical protein